jgi:hypothetical protein
MRRYTLRLGLNLRKGKGLRMTLVVNRYAGDEFHSRVYCHSLEEAFREGYDFVGKNRERAFHLFPKGTVHGMFIGRHTDLSRETKASILDKMGASVNKCRQ